MKLLLTTIQTDCKYTDYAMRYLYSIVDSEDSPIDADMKTFGKYVLDGRIYEDIMSGRYDVVYFHCDALNERHIAAVAEMIKKASPTTAIVAGGGHVSFGTKAFMVRNPWIDFVIRGEGETVLFNFLNTVINYEFDFANIPGLAYRDGEEIIVNKYDEPIEIEDLPFPYDATELPADVVYYESMRGDSSMAAYTTYYPDNKIRTLSLGRICRELRYFLVKEVQRVVFFDRFFNYSTERAYRVFEYLINNDNGITTFEFSIDGENLDDQTIRLLSEARPGLFEFNIEVASTNAEVLASVDRKENIYQLMYNVTKLLRSETVKCYIHIIAGLPNETEALFGRSFNKAFGLAEGQPVKIDFLQLSRGSVLRSKAEKFGYCSTFDSPYDVISNDHMPALDLIRIRTVARVIDAFIGEGGFKSSIPRFLADIGMRPYDLFGKLTDYICENELQNKLGKPENVARIFRAYAESPYGMFEDEFKFDVLTGAIHADLQKMVPEEAMVKFERDGWDIV
ncbi:MAG: DUF4080 domain-containing protein [Mogibacterium sp.]|nr:DUF4080 domain-containing protein [Mogibacterium sp.]